MQESIAPEEELKQSKVLIDVNLRQNEPARPQLLREEQKFEDGEQFLSAVEDPIKLSVNEESEI